jgi:crotonobetainyl-CoA:carnitine CoA-transferase CaiB-like acyl-CoA transferase
MKNRFFLIMPAKRKTIFTLEQALALPYATQRFVHLGWRVIRIESPAESGKTSGDPNRYIGADVGYPDLHSYYIAPNVGKEAITINLKTPEGRRLLLELIKKLEVDVFMCNTLPRRYCDLGIDYKTLSASSPNLIWCGISAFGPKYPDAAGYDPALQAMLGFTYLTGEPHGLPVPSGIPVIDLKAGDEAFAQVLLAMLQQQSSPGGQEIHISMAQCAASWLITALPQLNFVNNEDELFMRSGNEHRSFIPCNAYPTSDGYVYLAIGNDLQWARFTSQPGFESLASASRNTNQGRMDDKENIYTEIGALTRNFTTNQFVQHCMNLNLAVAPINSIKQVAALEAFQSDLLKTMLPNGKEAVLQPPSHTTSFLKSCSNKLNCAPRLGEHNREVLAEAGFTDGEIAKMAAQKVI